MIKNVVFDLGGVLVDWDPKNLYRKIFETEEDVEHFLDYICPYAWNLEQDRGRSLAAATRERISHFPMYREEIKAYYDRWIEMFSGVFPENVSLLSQLIRHSDLRVFALTNWSGETFPWAMKRFPFLGDFEGVVISGVEKVIKPDPAIYQILFDRYQILPEESVFIDDREENVDSAIRLGMQAIHFKQPMQLSNELFDLIKSFYE